MKKKKVIPYRSTKMDKKRFVRLAADKYGINAVISSDDIDALVAEHQLPYPTWFTANRKYRVGWGRYKLPLLMSHVRALEEQISSESATVVESPKMMLVSPYDETADDFQVDDVDDGAYVEEYWEQVVTMLHRLITSVGTMFKSFTQVETRLDQIETRLEQIDWSLRTEPDEPRPLTEDEMRDLLPEDEDNKEAPSAITRFNARR